MFFIILMVGICFVVAQGVASHRDGWFNQRQMKRLGNSGYAFVEHGGMWADIFTVSPAIALIISKYHMEYFSWWSVCIFTITTIITVCSVSYYELAGVTKPEAHTHYGTTTIAGWIHGFYAVIAMWVFILFFLTPISPEASAGDLLAVAILLSVLFPIGTIHFNPRWKWVRANTWQVAIELVIVWSIVTFKILTK